MIGPLGVYILMSAVVAAYGARRAHGFWRLLALGIVFTPVAVFFYLLWIERAMAGRR